MCVVVLCCIDHVWYSKECVRCACDPNERVSAPSICFVCVCVCCWVWWSERKWTLVCLCKLCPVCFLVVGKALKVRRFCCSL